MFFDENFVKYLLYRYTISSKMCIFFVNLIFIIIIIICILSMQWETCQCGVAVVVWLNRISAIDTTVVVTFNTGFKERRFCRYMVNEQNKWIAMLLKL